MDRDIPDSVTAVRYVHAEMGERDRPADQHFGCPYCCSFAVDRIFVASAAVDACRCRACGASWDEDATSGQFRGRSDRQSLLVRPDGTDAP